MVASPQQVVASTIARSESAVLAYQDVDTKTIARDLGLSAAQAALVGALGSTNIIVPGAPTGVAATVVSPTKCAITLTPGAANADSFGTSYKATSTPGGFVDTFEGSGDLITMPFVKATAYTFIINQVNAAGQSSNSAATAAVTPNP
jgi:hypothetical protein